MNYFVNQLHQLENENKYSFQQINSNETRKSILKMLKYLPASSISLYQIQIIKKDLIGMAMEAETEHITLEEKLGIDFKDFCDEIIQNAAGTSRTEQIMRNLLTVVQAFTIYFAIKFFLLRSAPAAFGIDYADLIWLVIWCLGGVFLPEYLEQKLAIYQGFKYKLPSFVCRICAFFCFALLLTTPLSSNYIITGSGWTILAITIILLLAVTTIMNIHWDKCSQKFSH